MTFTCLDANGGTCDGKNFVTNSERD